MKYQPVGIVFVRECCPSLNSDWSPKHIYQYILKSVSILHVSSCHLLRNEHILQKWWAFSTLCLFKHIFSATFPTSLWVLL